ICFVLLLFRLILVPDSVFSQSGNNSIKSTGLYLGFGINKDIFLEEDVFLRRWGFWGVGFSYNINNTDKCSKAEFGITPFTVDDFRSVFFSYQMKIGPLGEWESKRKFFLSN